MLLMPDLVQLLENYSDGLESIKFLLWVKNEVMQQPVPEEQNFVYYFFFHDNYFDMMSVELTSKSYDLQHLTYSGNVKNTIKNILSANDTGAIYANTPKLIDELNKIGKFKLNGEEITYSLYRSDTNVRWADCGVNPFDPVFISSISLIFTEQSVYYKLLDSDSESGRKSWFLIEVEKGIPDVITVIGKSGKTRYIQGPKLKDKTWFMYPLDATTNEIRKMYDRIAPHFEDIFPDNADIADFLLKKAKKYVPSKKSMVFDTFCGTGMMAARLSDYYEGIDMADISQKMLEIARGKFDTENLILQHDFAKPFPSALKNKLYGKYQVVTCGNGLLYLIDEKDLRKALENIAALMDSEKSIFVTVGRTNEKILAEYFNIIENGNYKNNNSSKLPFYVCSFKKR